MWGLLALAASLALPAATRAEAGPQDLLLLAFGDSLTHGYGLPAGTTFPEKLGLALEARGWKVRVINGGNSGETTAGGRARLDWALAEEPDAVILELGANDALRGLDPVASYANLEAMLGRLEVAEVPALLAGMRAPPNLGAEYVEAFNAIYPRLAAAHDVIYYPFFLDGVAARPALNQHDGIHPNAQGVEVIVDKILPRVEELLARAAAPAGGEGGEARASSRP
jgi:acyl-CoA thioesterase-1